MFERFTEKGIRVVMLSQEESRRMGHNFVGTEQIFLGLISEFTGIAGRMLRSYGITLAEARIEIESLVGRGSGYIGLEIPFTPRGKRVLEGAIHEARLLNHSYVSTQHLLLSLVEEDGCVGVKGLRRSGVDPNKVRDDILEFMSMDADGQRTARNKKRRRKKRPAMAKKSKNKNLVDFMKKDGPKTTEDILSEALKADQEEKSRNHLQFEEKTDERLIKRSKRKSISNVKKTASKSRPVLTGRLKAHAKDITLATELHEIDPCLGRDKEVERAVQILSRRRKNNPCLVGEPGTGKTAIAQGLAQWILDGKVPPVLQGKRILEVDIGGLIAGTKYRGEFEARLKDIIHEVQDAKCYIVFIDEIHTLVGAGAAEGAIDAANILKPPLARGEFQCMGATTIAEYRKYIERDKALERRFQVVEVKEPSIEQTVVILNGIQLLYESHHRVIITQDGIEAAARLSSQYLTDRYLPDKAIDVMDEACSRVRMGTDFSPKPIADVEEQLRVVLNLKNTQASKGNFIYASRCVVAEMGLRIRWLETVCSVCYSLMEDNEDQKAHILFWRYKELLGITTREKSFNYNSLEEFFEGDVFEINTQYHLYSTRIIARIAKHILDNRVLWFAEHPNEFKLDSEDLNRRVSPTTMKKNRLIEEILRMGGISDTTSAYSDGLRTSVFRILFAVSADSTKKYRSHSRSQYFWCVLRMLSFLGNDILTVNRKKNKVLAEAHRIIKEVKPMNYLERSRRLAPTVFAADMARVVASWTDVPVSIAGRDEAKVLLNLEDKLRERVIGQNDAITSLSKALRRSRMGLSDPNRPIASFLFCGPTGVGKTEITKALAQEFFGSEQNMVRLDMSEYMERHTTSKLIGAPPGYIGYNEGGQLTEAVRRTPYTVVLFDEVEKAHPDIFNLLLQVLDDGRLTDASNRTIDFTNTVVIMTSNLGAVDIQSYVAENISPERTLTSKENEKIKIELKELVQVSLRGFFRPEFLNRLDEIVVFQPLSTDSVSKIAHKLLSALKKRIRKKGYLLVITPPAHEEIVREGYDPLNGARPLRRVITNRIEDNIANLLLENPLLPETSIFVHLDDNGKIAIAYLDQEDVRRVTAQESARRLKEENKSKNSLY